MLGLRPCQEQLAYIRHPDSGPRERLAEHIVSKVSKREVEPNGRTGLGGGGQHAEYDGLHRLHRLQLKLAPLWMQALVCSDLPCASAPEPHVWKHCHACAHACDDVP